MMRCAAPRPGSWIENRRPPSVLANERTDAYAVRGQLAPAGAVPGPKSAIRGRLRYGIADLGNPSKSALS